MIEFASHAQRAVIEGKYADLIDIESAERLDDGTILAPSARDDSWCEFVPDGSRVRFHATKPATPTTELES